MGFIENIRNKPHETKIRIIWIIVGVVVALLLLAWLLVGTMEINPEGSFIGTISDRIGHPSKTFPKLFNKE